MRKQAKVIISILIAITIIFVALLFFAALFAKKLFSSNIFMFTIFTNIAFIVLIVFILIEHDKSKNNIENTNIEFQTVISNIPGGVVQFLYDDNLTITFLNEGLLNLTGYSLKEIEGELKNSFLNLIHKSYRQALASAIVDQMTTFETVELECKVKCKNEQYRWFLFKGRMITDLYGNTIGICVLTDINETKQTQQELFLNMQRYRIVSEQSDSIIFEYSFVDGSLYVSDKWNEQFSLKYQQEGFLQEVLKSDLVHKDDIDQAIKKFKQVKQGELLIEHELRLAKSENEYIWCRIKASAVFDEDGRIFKTIGKISNIDQQKKETEELTRQAKSDSLTGIYNKATTQSLINDYIKNDGKNKKHALFIIDLDNFKVVNDTMGHLVGDAVLTELATDLKSITRESDLIGRIGGDEFVIFFKNIEDTDFLKQKAEDVCKILKKTLTTDNGELVVSVSVGISIYNRDSNGFNELLDKADIALYEAKKRGRDQFWLYQNKAAI